MFKKAQKPLNPLHPTNYTPKSKNPLKGEITPKKGDIRFFNKET